VHSAVPAFCRIPPVAGQRGRLIDKEKKYETDYF
jgi:hypothetical protein